MATLQMKEDNQKKGAEVYHGASICREKVDKMLEEFWVPKCLFYSGGEYEEFGFNRAIGFFWLKQKSKTQRNINKVGTAYHDKEVSAFIQRRRVTKITGVKAKELLFTLTVSEMQVGVPSEDKVKFISTAGIYRVHPIAVFEAAMEKNHDK